jgi:hypothetical protein
MATADKHHRRRRMAATMSKSNWFRLNSFQIFDLMFNQRNNHKLTCLFTIVLILTCQCLADDGYEMDDFLKREHSLTKPYQGNVVLSFAGVVSKISPPSRSSLLRSVLVSE